MSRGQLAAALVVSVVLLGPVPGHAGNQGGRTPELVKTLTDLMDAAKLDSLAARVQGSNDQFVAALYFPGAQLLVVGATYSVPSLLNEKILLGSYRDVYIDLHSATDPESRVLIEDIRANGLFPQRTAENDAFDIYSRGRGSLRVAFDGEWRKQKLTEAAYKEAFQEAEAQYVAMLEALIEQMKTKAGSQ
jgi:hypothetical protein